MCGRNNVIVFLNFDSEQAQITYTNAPKGEYTNLFNGEDLIIKKTGDLSLAPNSFLVLTRD